MLACLGTLPNVDKLERLSYHELEKHRIPSKVFASGPSGRGSRENRETGAKPVRSRHCNRTQGFESQETCLGWRNPPSRKGHGDSVPIHLAVVETVFLRISDAVTRIAGGAPLAMAYRAVNTLDSIAQCATPVLRMGLRQVGLRNELCFGPVNGDTVWLVLTLLGGATLRRQVHRHPSLNAGIPEARMAGVLGVRLGGRDFCGGVSLLRAELGESTRPLNAEGIVRAVGVVRWCGVLVGLAALAEFWP